jgi:hypothetical protein
MSEAVAPYSPNRAKIFRLWFGIKCTPIPAHFVLIFWNVRRLTGIGSMLLIPESGQATGAITRLETGCMMQEPLLRRKCGGDLVSSAHRCVAHSRPNLSCAFQLAAVEE